MIENAQRQVDDLLDGADREASARSEEAEALHEQQRADEPTAPAATAEDGGDGEQPGSDGAGSLTDDATGDEPLGASDGQDAVEAEEPGDATDVRDADAPAPAGDRREPVGGTRR